MSTKTTHRKECKTSCKNAPNTLEFSIVHYQQFLESFEPDMAFTPFIDIDRKVYNKYYRDFMTSDSFWKHLKGRMAPDFLEKIRSVFNGISTCTKKYFPAYPFIVNTFMSSDWLSVVDWRKYQRDHILHQHLTTYICMELLEKICFENNSNRVVIMDETSSKSGDLVTFLDKAIEAIFNHHCCNYLRTYLKKCGMADRCLQDGWAQRLLWKQAFRDSLFAAATFHDTGYPWQFAQQIESTVGQYALFEDPAEKRAEKIFDWFSNRLLLLSLNGYAEKDPDSPVLWRKNQIKLIQKAWIKTHGFPGAISFLYWNDILRKYPNKTISPMRRFCGEWAAVAIMMHDMAKIYKPKNQVKYPQLRLSFKRDPLSFILTLADLIQDFGRQHADFYEKSTGKVEYQAKCKSVKLTFDRCKNELRIIYCFEKKGDYVQKLTQFIPKEQRLYFDPLDGFLDFSEIGIERITLDAELV